MFSVLCFLCFAFAFSVCIYRATTYLLYRIILVCLLPVERVNLGDEHLSSSFALTAANISRESNFSALLARI